MNAARIELQKLGHAPATCRSCGAPIRWATTVAGKAMPLNADFRLQHEGRRMWVEAKDTHWGSCPNANEHRRRT